MQEKADAQRHAPALDECGQKQQVGIMDPNKLFGRNYVGHTDAEELVHLMVAAP